MVGSPSTSPYLTRSPAGALATAPIVVAFTL
nr:MAG TPA: hypothetical protein [Caudoviricetes sp.]